MRFYHSASGRVLEAPRPRMWFFLVGPFYLAWLRLWKAAAITAVGVWVIVHAAIVITARAIDVPSRPDVSRALDLLLTIQSAPMTGASADAAFQEMVAMLMPFLTGGFVLLILASLMAVGLPHHLIRYYGRRGYVLLRTDEDELAEIDGIEV